MPDSQSILNRKTLLLTGFIYAGLVCGFALIGLTALDWSKYQHLARNAVKTTGKVTAKEPQKHNSIRYSFEVDHKTYSGLGHAGGENPTFDELQVGAPVSVYYDPDQPDNSFLGNPAEQAASVTTGVGFLAFGGSLLSMIALYRKGWLPIFPA